MPKEVMSGTVKGKFIDFEVDVSDIPGTFESDLIALVKLYKNIKERHNKAIKVLNNHRHEVFGRGTMPSFEVLGIIDDALEVLEGDNESSVS